MDEIVECIEKGFIYEAHEKINRKLYTKVAVILEEVKKKVAAKTFKAKEEVDVDPKADDPDKEMKMAKRQKFKREMLKEKK